MIRPPIPARRPPTRRRAAVATFLALIISLVVGAPSPASAIGPVVSMPASLSVVEGTATGSQVLQVTVTRSGPAAEACNVTATVVLSGSASAGDFATLSPQNFILGASSSSFSLSAANIFRDSVDESDETFSIVLSGASFGSFPGCDVDPSATTTTVTILDDDDPVVTRSVSVNDVSRTEGNAGTATLAFTLRLDGPAIGNESVTVATANATALAGSDYVAVPPTVVTFVAGETTKSVTVTIQGDTVVEADETFELRLTAPSNVTIADGIGVGTVTNDDAPPPPPPPSVTVSIKDASRSEGNASSSPVTFPVTASAPVPVTCGFSYTVAHGTTNSADISTASGSGTVQVGTTESRVQVTMFGDRTVEPDETFTVTIVGSGSNPCAVDDGVATGTIKNDDRAKGHDHHHHHHHDRPKKPSYGPDKRC